MIKFLFGVVLICCGFYRTIFTDPVWGIYLFASLTHIRLVQLGENIPLPLNIPIAIATLTLILYLVSPQYRVKFARWPMEVWLMLLMVTGMALSSAGAEFRPDLSWKFTIDYLKYFAFFLLLINMVDSYEKVEWFHRVMILSAGWLVYRCWDLRGTTGARFENVGGDIIGDGNHYAAALVLLFPFVFQKTMSRNHLVAGGAAVLCFGVITAIFISGSRGGLVGVATLAFLIALNFKVQRKRVILVSLVVGAVAIFFMNDFQKERLQELVSAASEETRDGSAQGRVDFWRLATELFRENPVAGVGLGNFVYHSGHRVEGLAVGEAGHVTHSLWFEVLSEGGTVLALPFFFLLLRFFRSTKRTMKRLQEEKKTEELLYVITVRVALGAFLVTATFLNRLIYEPIYWCIGLGVIHHYLLQPQTEEIREPQVTTWT